MGVAFARGLGHAAHLAPQEWCVDQGVRLCCPVCEKVQTLDKANAIAPDGKAKERFACPDCPFFDFITLTGFGDK